MRCSKVPESRCRFALVNPELRKPSRAGAFGVDKFSRVQNPFRVEKLFELPMQVAHHLTGRVRPPAFFGQADSVLAGDHSTPGEYLFKKVVERTIDFFAHRGVAA